MMQQLVVASVQCFHCNREVHFGVCEIGSFVKCEVCGEYLQVNERNSWSVGDGKCPRCREPIDSHPLSPEGIILRCE